jgi:hypothetical protein
MKRFAMVAFAAALCAPQVAEAHVKWFCAYDTSLPPLPWSAVFTPVFLFIATGFAGLMFGAYLIDRLAERNGWLERIERGLLRCQPAILPFIRVAVCGFFLTLWMQGGLILTPELTTTSDWVPWLQLAIAASTLWRPTLVLAAAGITALYLFGVAEYGAFHMMDYPVFLGIAAYLGFSAFEHPQLSRLRLPALYFNVALTMMWGAIEKFGYPCWTFPLMATHGALTLGIPFDWFMIIAGFVEFSLAFFMLTGTALLRLASLALLALLVSAVPEFGMVDAIGHALIIVVLAVMIITGQRGIGLPALLRREGVVTQSSVMLVAYGATMMLLFSIYYSSQYIAGR